MGYIAKRLSEPSTYAGLSGLAVSIGISADAYQVYATAAAGIFGVVAFLLKEESA